MLDPRGIGDLMMGHRFSSLVAGFKFLGTRIRCFSFRAVCAMICDVNSEVPLAHYFVLLALKSESV